MRRVQGLPPEALPAWRALLPVASLLAGLPAWPAVLPGLPAWRAPSPVPSHLARLPWGRLRLLASRLLQGPR